MIVRVNWSALKQSRWYEYVLRFALGGLATALAGAAAEFFGPEGGLFLAFPAIFCASATLIEKHERERKQKLGLFGDHRGKEAAALDAAGAGLGSLGLAAFGLCVWLLAEPYFRITGDRTGDLVSRLINIMAVAPYVALRPLISLECKPVLMPLQYRGACGGMAIGEDALEL
jgi:hypothetical protein